MKNLMKRFWKEEDGQALSEYGVILGIILVGVIGAITALSDQILSVFESITDSLNIGG
ncbi:Flp family type IVb pilin [Salibacterium aidingense]|uniref:Flp family type IVb pilin n=1 Tax=Salibacterium aidingense TaxID=384933 RepID=UPI0003F942F4|nr:Flp family type IVb pilin [Salibacterium aidingense]